MCRLNSNNMILPSATLIILLTIVLNGIFTPYAHITVGVKLVFVLVAYKQLSFVKKLKYGKWCVINRGQKDMLTHYSQLSIE